MFNPHGVYGVGTRLEIDFEVASAETESAESGNPTAELETVTAIAIVLQKKEPKLITDLTPTDVDTIYVEGRILSPDPFDAYRLLTPNTIYPCRRFYSLDEIDLRFTEAKFQLIARLESPVAIALVGQQIKGYLTVNVVWGEGDRS